MSIKAIRKVLVANAVAEIDLLKKGEIDKANQYLTTRITATDKLWVVENFNTTANKDLIEYAWEQVKELALLLTDSNNKDGITCLGSMPVDDLVVPCGEYVPPVVKHDLGLNILYKGESGRDDGLLGSFNLNGQTHLLSDNPSDYVRLFKNTYKLLPGVHNFDFHSMIYRRDGNNQNYELEYQVDTGSWTKATSKAFSVNINNASISVEVRATEIRVPDKYNVNVDLEYIGGNGSSDGFTGSFSIQGVVKPIGSYYRKDFYATYPLNVGTQEFNFTLLDYYINGNSVAFDLEYKLAGGVWTSAPTKIFNITVNSVENLFVRGKAKPADMYDLNLNLSYSGGNDANDGLSGSYMVNLNTEAITNFTKLPIVKSYNLTKGTQVLNFASMAYMDNGVSIDPYKVEYKIGVGGTYADVPTKIVNINLDSDKDVFVRASVIPPVTHKLTNNINYVGGTGDVDGLSGSFTIDISSETIVGYKKTINKEYDFVDGVYTFNYSNTIYNDNGVNRPFTIRYRKDSGAWQNAPTKTFDVTLSGADVVVEVEFKVEEYTIKTDLSLSTASDPADHFKGSFTIDGTVHNVGAAPTDKQVIVYVPMTNGFHTWDLNGISYQDATGPVSATYKYKVGTTGTFVNISGKTFTKEITGVSEIYIEATKVAPPTYHIGVEMEYFGDMGVTNGFGGSFTVGGQTINYPEAYTIAFGDVIDNLPAGTYTLDFALTEYKVNGVAVQYFVEYRDDANDPWVTAAGKTVNVTIVDSNIEKLIRLVKRI